MERTGESLEAPAASSTAQLELRESYKMLVERKCYCYLPPFSAPNSDLFLLPSHSILPFFTFNLDHPNGSITHVMSPQDVCERRGCVRAAGWSVRAAAQWCLSVLKQQTGWGRLLSVWLFLFYERKSYSIAFKSPETTGGSLFVISGCFDESCIECFQPGYGI